MQKRLTRVRRRPLSITWASVWAESFIFAGSSALMLLVAGLHPGHWYLSVLALTPFLYRIVHASVRETVRLGLLLGLAYFLVLGSGSALMAPVQVGLRVVAGAALLTLFGLAVGLAKRRWGFNPAIVALLWVTLELGLVWLGFVHGLLGGVEALLPFLHGLAMLFGFLIVSCIVVLASSVLVLAVERVIAYGRVRGVVDATGSGIWVAMSAQTRCFARVYLVPEVRGPPGLAY